MAEIKELVTQAWAIPWIRTTIQTVIRLLVTALLSGFIGYEREHSHRPAGFRTHILVAVGSTLIMLTSVYMFERYEGLTNLDPARLGAQVVSGIGFLGAGTILREGFSVKGLTTAASLWAVSCIGLAVGMGYYSGAIIATAVIYVTLNRLKKFVVRGNVGKTIYVEVENLTEQARQIGKIIRKSGANLDTLEILYSDESFRSSHRNSTVLKAFFYPKNDSSLDLITDSIRTLEGVRDIYVD